MATWLQDEEEKKEKIDRVFIVYIVKVPKLLTNSFLVKMLRTFSFKSYIYLDSMKFNFGPNILGFIDQN